MDLELWKKRYKELGFKNYDELAKAAHVSKRSIEDIFRGYTKTPRIDTVEAIERALGINESSSNFYSQFSNIYPVSKQKIPLLGRIACGKPIYAEEERESYVTSGTEINADFCLIASGDSMINARILNGDIVFCRKQEIVENGEIAAVVINDEATLKRVFYFPEKKKLVLQAENPKYEPLVYVNEELDDIRIIGKAIAFQSDVK